MKAFFLGIAFAVFVSGCASFSERSAAAVDVMANASGSAATGYILLAGLLAFAFPDAVIHRSPQPQEHQPPPRVMVSQPQLQPMTVRENGYGLGVHQDPYGRAVKYEVIGQPNVDTSLLKIKQNAYGPGIHMDQYGRAVRTVSAW